MDTRLKDSEWILLKALWRSAPLDLKGITEAVKESEPDIKWDYKTYHSFLRLLLDKGFVRAEKQGRNNLYYPCITEKMALEQESESILSRRPYYGTVSSLVINMAETGRLTADEKSELMELARKLAEESKKSE